MTLPLSYTAVRHRPRILIESYECSPVRGHAPGSAWQIISRLSQWFELWIITEQVQYQKEIDDYLAGRPQEARYLHFHYISRTKTKGFGRQRPPLPFREILDYRRWLKKSYELALQLNAEIHFDLVHHLRSNTFREPGLLWKLGKPAIWGPVGGSYCVPDCLLAFLNLKNRFWYQIRNRLNRFQFTRGQKVKEAFQAMSVILAQTSFDVQFIRQIHHRKAVLCHEQGIGQIEDTTRSWDGRRPLRIVWAARCISGKALPILLQALEGRNENRKVELHVIGDGVELKRWKQEAAQRHIDYQCIWHGWKTPQETRNIMNQADILAITSILDATSATIMEALGMGLGVIALQHCGFRDVLDSECGILIPCRQKNQIVADFRQAIISILKNPGHVEQMSRAALKRGQSYTWDSIAKKIRSVYEHALNSQAIHTPWQPDLESPDLDAQTLTSEAECLI